MPDGVCVNDSAKVVIDSLDLHIKNLVAPLKQQLEGLQEENTSLRKKLDELLETLDHITEYWNRDQNEHAMYDALWYIIETAKESITNAKKELDD